MYISTCVVPSESVSKDGVHSIPYWEGEACYANYFSDKSTFQNSHSIYTLIKEGYFKCNEWLKTFTTEPDGIQRVEVVAVNPEEKGYGGVDSKFGAVTRFVKGDNLSKHFFYCCVARYMSPEFIPQDAKLDGDSTFEQVFIEVFKIPAGYRYPDHHVPVVDGISAVFTGNGYGKLGQNFEHSELNAKLFLNFHEYVIREKREWKRGYRNCYSDIFGKNFHAFLKGDENAVA